MSKAWQGFVTESKRFMNHPDYWHEWDAAAPYAPSGWTQASKRRAAFKFWCAFPRAAVRFYWLCLRDFMKSFAEEKP